MALDLSNASLSIGACVFLIAGFVKGVIGLGLPTVAIGLLGLVMTPVQAASLLVVPSLATNLWQLAAGPGIRPLLRRFWPLMAGICIGTWSGGALLAGTDRTRAGVLLGFALIAYALVGLGTKQLSLSSRVERWCSPLIGVMTGVVAAATGVFVVPAVPYLQALGLAREELVQTLGLSFTVSTVALAMLLTYDGNFQLSVAGASLLALLPASAGMFVGQWVRGRVRAATFRLCFFIGLLLLGAHLALRSFF
jgi:uncharacterized protein